MASRARRERIAVVALLALASVALYLGWRTFRFTCDDAYIAFRYVNNRRWGWGYAWNPPPFRPVDGYTSFLWIVILDLVWSWLGVAPTASANWIALGFSFGSVALTSVMVLRVAPRPARVPLLALTLIGVLTNRTFLAWTSSGLETALFTFLLLAWTYVCFFAGSSFARSLVASLLALCRPDGALFVIAAAVLAIVELARAPRLRARSAVPLLPFALPAFHLAWRRWTYGTWLPNTYYAKHSAPWPLSGAIYLASFLLEYAFWIWLVVALACVVAWARSAYRGVSLVRALGGGALAAHFAYYTFVIGGDHFEFRVYAHGVPLVFVSLVAMASRLRLGPRATYAIAIAMIALGLPLPWLHWWRTRELTSREGLETSYAVAPLLPPPLRTYARAWDATQAWLAMHLVCVRHHEHKIFASFMRHRLPSREFGLTFTSDDVPVAGIGSVGVCGWVLPHVAIIDLMGLNDRVIARTPPRWQTRGELRKMAHERSPPPGYLDCFRPNVVQLGDRVAITKREEPLTASEIEACETRFGGPYLEPVDDGLQDRMRNIVGTLVGK